MLEFHFFAPEPHASASGTEALAAYDNCTELNRDFSHGVSNKKKPRSWWIRRGATGKGAYKPNLYRSVQASMDRDHDNIACEK